MTAMENGSYHGAKHRNGDAITETPSVDDVFDDTYKEKDGPKPPMILVWRNIILMTLLHMGALYGLTLIPSASALTLAWTAVCYLFSALSVTAGAHRLWCHRSYKASLPLRIFLALCNSMAFQINVTLPLVLALSESESALIAKYVEHRRNLSPAQRFSVCFRQQTIDNRQFLCKTVSASPESG
uniref:Uncharacterized protein n=1 Tax=Monopterus albus TaxID=43700 RepID=A0A3Q3QAA7_MONAL